jgi:hypothetical protein
MAVEKVKNGELTAEDIIAKLTSQLISLPGTYLPLEPPTTHLLFNSRQILVLTLSRGKPRDALVQLPQRGHQSFQRGGLRQGNLAQLIDAHA